MEYDFKLVVEATDSGYKIVLTIDGFDELEVATDVAEQLYDTVTSGSQTEIH